jgi:IS30 family transposase
MAAPTGKALTDQEKARAAELYRQGYSTTDVGAALTRSPATVWKYLSGASLIRKDPRFSHPGAKGGRYW